MDNIEEKFHNDGQSVRLLASEKEIIKRRVLRAGAEHPVPTFFPFFHVGRIVAASLILFVAGGSSLTYAAQRSAPGDMLYHIELYVVEPIEAAVQITPTAKAAYSTNRLEERLREVQETRQEEIPAEEVAVVTKNIEEHVQQVLSTLPDQPETDKNVDQLVKVSALLNVQDDLLPASAENVDVISELQEDVANELTEQVSDYADENQPIDLVQEVQETVMETSELIGGAASTTENTDISEHLANVQDNVADGNLDAALQEAVSAKVQALEQEYSTPDAEEAEEASTLEE